MASGGDSFGFYTAAGEDTARRLIGGVLADVDEDRISRPAKALDLIADALELVVRADGHEPGAETWDAVAERVNVSFSQAGFVAVTGQDLRVHCDNWSRRGSAVRREDSHPVMVSDIRRAVARLTTACDRLDAREGLVLRVTGEVHGSGYHEAVAARADLVVHLWNSDIDGMRGVGCVLSYGADASFIEHVLDCGDAEGFLRDVGLPDRALLDYAAAVAEMSELHAAMAALNETSARLGAPDRLGLKPRDEGMPGARIVASWDGQELVAAVPVRAAHAAPVARHSVHAVSLHVVELGEDTVASPGM